MPASFPGRPILLAAINYDEWIEEKREWFKGQFPWIFELQSALAKKGIGVAYSDLLIRSGDIWQIVYPHRFYRQIAVVQKDGLAKVANTYQLDGKWLDRIISQAARSLDLPSSQVFFGEDALNQWHTLASELERGCGSTNTPIVLWEYSMVASQYLENTRTFVWLCIQNGTFSVASNQKEALLDLLEQQISSAYQAGQAAWHLSPKGILSAEVRGQSLIKSIEAIRENEKQISYYRLRPTGN